MKIHSLFGLTVSLTSLCVVHTSVVANGAQDQTAIRPFSVPTVPQKDLDDLRRRVAATRWPEKETVGDQWREGLGSLRFFRQPPAPAPFAAFAEGLFDRVRAGCRLAATRCEFRSERLCSL